MAVLSLLKKYISGEIKSEDFKELKRISLELTDQELGDAFEILWSESHNQTMDSAIKAEIQKSLRYKLLIEDEKNEDDDDEEKRLAFNWKNIVAAVLIPVLFLSTAYLYFARNPVQEFTVSAEKGQKTQIYLPDGTKVWLNSQTTLSYNSDYNQNNRLVKLQGEAFFDVKKNTSSKFIVEADNVNVVVHGTAFDVLAYSQDSLITVSLNRGKVVLENRINQSVIGDLIPNQKVTINKKTMAAEFSICDAELRSLWILNKLKVEEITATELFKKMENWYGINIHLTNIDPKIKYTLTIKTESLREMLDLINKLTPITYSITGEEVNIKYKI